MSHSYRVSSLAAGALSSPHHGQGVLLVEIRLVHLDVESSLNFIQADVSDGCSRIKPKNTESLEQELICMLHFRNSLTFIENRALQASALKFLCRQIEMYPCVVHLWSESSHWTLFEGNCPVHVESAESKLQMLTELQITRKSSENQENTSNN